jgi:D-3-phosphoglycerate dehydrogenase / 2-oxoglutarate reductase
LLLAITRGVTAHANSDWTNADTFGAVTSLRGVGLGVVGFGRIGRAVAERAQAFGMKIGAFDPNVQPAEIEATGAEPVSIEDAFRREVVTLHLPLVVETQRFVSRELLSLMPEGSILLNVARGGLIDESALLEGLEVGHPAYAGLDVLETEPPPPDHPLVSHPRAIVTPHMAYYSPRSIVELRRLAATRLVTSLGHGN